MLRTPIGITICIFSMLKLTLCFAEDKPVSYESLRAYIHQQWSTLTRDTSKCRSYADLKIKTNDTLFFPPAFLALPSLKKLQTNCAITLKLFPREYLYKNHTTLDLESLHGLLYLPHPYVVPGGMFNEMYGWDSYFIIRGLLQDQQLTLAKGMVENLFFEIVHYGHILNANRIYYLSRSQPPFLTSMILSVYEAMQATGQADLHWLARAYRIAREDYAYWTETPHLVTEYGLSRFYDMQAVPAMELLDAPDHYYQQAANYFYHHPAQGVGMMAQLVETNFAGELYTVTRTSPAATIAQPAHIGLSKRFYRNDRALRESGTDISFRFGAYGAHTTEFLPVDLNSLLYKVEKDLAWMAHTLKKKSEAALWEMRAAERRDRINHFLWHPDRGLYFDYHFVQHQSSDYVYLSTFYPLWVGLATSAQARAVHEHLADFERPGGLLTSLTPSGAQWDYPYGWAPLQLIAIEGLRRYGYDADADRISRAFLDTVNTQFMQDGTLREKYDVLHRNARTHIRVGYRSNEVGFGWTNGVVLCLLNDLKS